ncbi:hypothetical protein SteCoe_37247 [Stentor coeruleus]|uniref:Uncharacterized protein n=1 Tax=Stentor coeruleus TaxID=5963 RepID=A0A1R2ANI4_9CILI|nr:hypothetical protein SteCoe_37247 [Stentor coeruleus]
MSTVAKYWDKYRDRQRSDSVEKPDATKVINDKQAYVSFLEVQLERVTQTVLTTQGFSDRIETLQTQVNSSEEKIINLTRLVKLQQTYAESQEEEISNLKKNLGSGYDNKQSYSGIQCLERRVQSIEERLDFQKFKEKDSKYENFVEEMDLALKNTENKITGLLNKTTEEIEAKQKKYQKNVESSLQQYNEDMNLNYRELSLKISKAETCFENKGKITPDIEKNRFMYKENFEEENEQGELKERLRCCEKTVKDLEQFLVAIAEEVKKVEEQHLDTSDIECRISEKLNTKVEKLGELVKKVLDQKNEQKNIQESPVKFGISPEFKESPKFPNILSSVTKSFQEDRKSRSESKDSDILNSKEILKSPKSKKSDSSIGTPKPINSIEIQLYKKSKDSKSSSRTPKSRKSSSPNTIPLRQKPNLSPGSTPKTTNKFKTMENNLKQKIKQLKNKDLDEKRQTLKKEEKKDEKKIKKKIEKKSKLDKLYKELSGKAL